MRKRRNLREKLLWALALFSLNCTQSDGLIVTQCEDEMRNAGPIIQSDRANPGRSVVVKPDPLTATTPASLLIVPAQPGDPVGKATVMEIDGSDDESQVMTVTLVGESINFPTPSNQAGQARSVAQVEWGVAGVQAQAFVDYIHGLSFSIPASWIRITAINSRLPLADPLAPANLIFGRNIRAGAFCSYGSVGRSGGLSAKLSSYYGPVSGPPGPIPGLLPVPPFATNFIFYPRFGAAGPIPFTITVLDEQLRRIMDINYPATANPADFNPIELPDNASAIELSTTAAGNLTGVIVFGISI